MAAFAADPCGRVGPRNFRLAARYARRLGFRGRAVRVASRTHFRRNPRGRASSRAADRPRLVYLTSIRRTSPGSRRIPREFAGKRAARSRACTCASDPSVFFAIAFSGRFQRAFGAFGPASWGIWPGFSTKCGNRCYDGVCQVTTRFGQSNFDLGVYLEHRCVPRHIARRTPGT